MNKLIVEKQHPAVLLSTIEMYAADRAAITGGVPGVKLMETAGQAVADAVQIRFPRGRVVVLCGPGNNGGDGFVAARLLQQAGWEVVLALLGQRDSLKGDAAAMAARWRGPILPLSPEVLDGATVVVDALFGAGLCRPLKGIVREVVKTATEANLPVVAVDVPSGVHGDTGQVLGMAFYATATVTFFRKKPGHVLYPGRSLCGEVTVADIGIPESVLLDIQPQQWENTSALWQNTFPRPQPTQHKFSRGFAAVTGGGAMTGATRLAARAAQRAGAGYVQLICPEQTVWHYRMDLPSVVVKGYKKAEDYWDLLSDVRLNSLLIGPGLGQKGLARGCVLAVLERKLPTVLDADALTLFSDRPEELFCHLHRGCLLTPHEGEFARLFPDLAAQDPGKLEKVRAAAQRANCVVLLKGPDTVIAAPDGRAVINTNAPPYLATAGSGDVLAGFVTGLLAQTKDAFLSAIMGAWLHGAAGHTAGPGLIAEDLTEAVRRVVEGMR